MTQSEPDLLNVYELAAMLGCSDRTIRTWRREGMFPPPIRLGRRAIRWRKSVVQAWLGASAG